MLAALTTALAFLRTPLGRYVAVALGVAFCVGMFYLWAYHKGAAASLAAAAAASAAAVARANRARAKVDHSQEAINADAQNRDRH